VGNRPDIVLKNKADKTCLLIDVAVPSDRNIIQMEAEKKLKYKNLSIEIQLVWNMKCFVIPVIIGAMGIVSKIKKRMCGNITRTTLNRFSTKKIAIRETLHIREVLQSDLKPDWFGSPSVGEERYQGKENL
jgi:hypothetical protein